MKHAPFVQHRLVQHFPQLGPLAPGELKTYLAAFDRRQRRTEATRQIFTLVIAACVFAITTASTGVLLRPVIAGLPWIFGGLLWAILCSTAGVLSTGWFLRDRYRRARHAALALLLHVDRQCAGCRYDLRGVQPLPDRPGLARCPECSLINPHPRVAPEPRARPLPRGPGPEQAADPAAF